MHLIPICLRPLPPLILTFSFRPCPNVPPSLQAKDKKDGSTYYKVAATAQRRDFDDDILDAPLTVVLEVDGDDLDNSLDCTVKEGVKGQLRATCKP
jgi:hypothetical protein